MLIPTCIIKFMELSLAISCLTLHQYSYDLTDLPTLMLCSGTYVAYIIVLSGEIVGEAVSAAADAYIDGWWSGCGAVLYGACGALTLRSWRDVPKCHRRSYAQASAVCAIAAAALLTIDALFAFCSASRDDTSTRAKSCKTNK
ncbi:uncharacterized protein LOC101743423 isoform X1 [Bombyx mori]|uniref:Uncharacterized protein n=1 Tax=Bombyx mori TaxID=7091 RepID=A0A8R2DPJ3_BOMMO|nr:uncharacterized protein LOC101743423 isoform X1 [Bombyx mori]